MHVSRTPTGFAALAHSLAIDQSVIIRKPTVLLLSLIQDGTQKSQKVFVNIPTEVGASEPEEIGAFFDTSLVHSARHP